MCDNLLHLLISRIPVVGKIPSSFVISIGYIMCLTSVKENHMYIKPEKFGKLLIDCGQCKLVEAMLPIFMLENIKLLCLDVLSCPSRRNIISNEKELNNDYLDIISEKLRESGVLFNFLLQRMLV